MPFAYLKDPLFLLCLATYCIHRGMVAGGISLPLLQSHLNDLICIPFWVPIMLWGERRLGLRRHERPPNAIEIIIPLIVISAAYEVIIPYCWERHVNTVPDPKDILAYCIGSLIATIVWNVYYGRQG